VAPAAAGAVLWSSERATAGGPLPPDTVVWTHEALA
jgi:hypothetical protein